ncbi:MAG: family 16 glycoside hydrolase [Planctomycetota bacterium]
MRQSSRFSRWFEFIHPWALLALTGLGLHASVQPVVRADDLAQTTTRPKLILDSDTANEIDDLYAIVRLLGQKKFDVLGLTSAQWFHHLGDPNSVEASQQINEDLLSLLGREDLLAPIGASRPMGKPWGGNDPRNSPACQFIIDQARAIPEDDHLIVVSIGATTNVASAIKMAPDIAKKVKVYLMGFRYDDRSGVWNKSEFNVRRDLNAADFLLSHPDVELHIMSANLSRQFTFDRDDAFHRQSKMGPVGNYLTERWKRHSDAERWVMWDLALVQAMLRPEWVHEKQVPGPPENNGRTVWVYDRIDVSALRNDFWNMAEELALCGRWAFQLPDGNPAWLDISLGRAEQPFDASLLWSVGSGRPASVRLLDNGTLEIQRNIRWKPGGGEVTKQISRPMRVQLTAEDTVQLRFTQTNASEPNGPVESLTLVGTRIPTVPRRPDLSQVVFGEPIQLFNGQDLTGWQLHREDKQNGWSVVEGVLKNESPKKTFAAYGDYGNLRTTDAFDDFQLSLEYNVPAGGNSGVYLRGMYEAQVVDRDSRMQGISGPGAIFGRLTPRTNAGKAGGEWNRYVLTLVDRHITVELNGQIVIDNQKLIGCTGGGIQAHDSEPGPILLQGDHTSVQYRNITLRHVISKITQEVSP